MRSSSKNVKTYPQENVLQGKKKKIVTPTTIYKNSPPGKRFTGKKKRKLKKEKCRKTSKRPSGKRFTGKKKRK